MKQFAVVFLKDLKENGLAYIWLYKTAEFIEQYKDSIIFVEQNTATSVSLLAEVRKLYPEASFFSDTHFNYIKTK